MQDMAVMDLLLEIPAISNRIRSTVLVKETVDQPSTVAHVLDCLLGSMAVCPEVGRRTSKRKGLLCLKFRVMVLIVTLTATSVLLANPKHPTGKCWQVQNAYLASASKYKNDNLASSGKSKTPIWQVL